MKALGRQGRLLEEDDPLMYALDRAAGRPQCDGAAVPGAVLQLVYPNGERLDGVRCDMICLQEELSPQRRELVLRHEWSHIRLNHGWMKSWACGALLLFWWNPILWAAYRCFCRDLELACDEKTLEGLHGPGGAPGVRPDPVGAGGGAAALGGAPGLRGERRGPPGEGGGGLAQA